MARDVCPQIFAQSRRRWSSNWNSSYLAEFQSINYFRRFSKVIECNCDSFALINRMQMPRCGDSRRPGVWKLFQRRKRTRTPSAQIFVALSPLLSVSLSRSPSISRSLVLSRRDWQSLWFKAPPRSPTRFTVRQIKYDSENCRHNGER